MCYRLMNIKHTSTSGVSFGYVPCGKCEECRDVSKSAWSFRLCAEIESVKAQGWKVGFCTLTYDPEHLPLLDKKFFKPGSATYLQDIPCFNREHIRSYILAFRNWLFKTYCIKSIKYMVVTEYGKHTARPHYHLLVAWNPDGFARKVDEKGRFVRSGRKFLREKCFVDAKTVHAWLKSNWSYGFVLPENFEGGFRRKNGVLIEIKPFEVVNAGVMAARYAAKYVCKDLAFPDFVKVDDFVGYDDLTDEEWKELKNCSPFHCQSQSLGLSLIKNATPAQLVQLFESGYCFDCETEFKQLPTYLKHKILFSPKYCIDEDGKRLVRRDATKFFKEHYVEIYERRVSQYQDIINECLCSDFWIDRGVSVDSVEHFTDLLDENLKLCSLSPRLLAEHYVSYFGVDYAKCYDVDRSLQWFMRYCSIYDSHGSEIDNHIDTTGLPLLDHELYDRIHIFWNGLLNCLSRTNGWKDRQKDYTVDEVYDFWNLKIA